MIATFCASTPTPAVDRLERLARDLRTARCFSLVRLWPFTPAQVLQYVERRFSVRVAEEIALPLFEAGELRPVVDSTFPFDRIGDAHRHMEANANTGKIVVTLP